MTNPPKTIAELEAAGTVTPSEFNDVPDRIAEIADEALQVPANFVEAIDRVLAAGLYDREDIEEAFACLVGGHLLLAGPPGTGKTQLARQLAAAFDCAIVEETANPEWSVYDIIGAAALPGSSPPYRDGILTRAVIGCANRIVANLDTGAAPQSTWLLIDEINRAEIDRAFGPLFTALSETDSGSYTLDYRPAMPVVAIPRRFRIIATMNSFDTRFVNSMSAALRRRFGRVAILPPSNSGEESSPQELDLALLRADALVAGRLKRAPGSLRNAVDPYAVSMREAIGAIRVLGDHGGVPVGTAQVIDTCILLLTLIGMRGVPADKQAFDELFDRALSSRMISALESDAARSRLRPTYAHAFAERFPALSRANKRLESFLSGND